MKDLFKIRVKRGRVYTVFSVFNGLEDSWVLKRLIKDRKKRIVFLKTQRIIFTSSKWPHVLNPKHITFPFSYLNEPEKENYLDILHELTHCFQREKENIDFRKQIRRFEYYDNPKELEAYSLGLVQARKIGMTKEDYAKYLNGDGFLSKREINLLLKNVFKFKIK